jgi:hypothetical protein
MVPESGGSALAGIFALAIMLFFVAHFIATVRLSPE